MCFCNLTRYRPHVLSLGWAHSFFFFWLSWTDISFLASLSSEVSITSLTSVSQLQTLLPWGFLQASCFLPQLLKPKWKTASLLHSSWLQSQHHVDDGKICDSLKQTYPPQTTVVATSEFLESWTQGHAFLDTHVNQRSSESSCQSDIFQKS